MSAAPPTQATPRELRVTDATCALEVAWDDDHVSRYPWWYLRGLCPCAACQGHGGPTRFVGDAPGRLGDIDEVGNYALRLVWDEAHTTGIYSFAYLRALCPCSACLQAAGAAHLSGLLSVEQQARLAEF